MCDCGGQCCGVPDDDVASRIAELVKTSMNVLGALAFPGNDDDDDDGEERESSSEAHVGPHADRQCDVDGGETGYQPLPRLPDRGPQQSVHLPRELGRPGGPFRVREAAAMLRRGGLFSTCLSSVYFACRDDYETVSFLIQVLEDDGLPTSICLDCTMKVNVAYELRKQCQKADVELRKLYGKALRTNVASNFITTKVLCFYTSKIFILILFRLLNVSLLLCRISVVKLSNLLDAVSLMQSIWSKMWS